MTDFWYYYYKESYPNNNDECNEDNTIVTASAGVCLYDDWETLIPYFDTLFEGMGEWPDVVALRGSNCPILSELDVTYGIASISHNLDPKDCYCELCEGQKCTVHWGSTKRCLATTEIEFPLVVNLDDDPQYNKDLTVHKDGTNKVAHSTEHPESHGGGLIERENSLSSASNLSSITLFWLLVSIFTFLSLVVGLLSCEAIRRLWNRRQRLAHIAYRTNRSTSGAPQSIGIQDDDSELDPLSVELTPILNDRPICTPFHL